MLSDPLSLSSACSQGGVLSPTLFSLNINDLFKSLPPGSVAAYADDITIFLSGIIINEAVTNSEALLAYISEWAAQNDIAISVPKCAVTVIPPYIQKQTLIIRSFCLSNLVLNNVNEMRMLRVTLTSDLKWFTHASRIRASATEMIGVLNRFSCTLNVNARNKILQAFIIPKFAHCIPVWGHIRKKDFFAIDQMLQRAARVNCTISELSSIRQLAKQQDSYLLLFSPCFAVF